jgi:hypothetical protein
MLQSAIVHQQPSYPDGPQRGIDFTPMEMGSRSADNVPVVQNHLSEGMLYLATYSSGVGIAIDCMHIGYLYGPLGLFRRCLNIGGASVLVRATIAVDLASRAVLRLFTNAIAATHRLHQALGLR